MAIPFGEIRAHQVRYKAGGEIQKRAIKPPRGAGVQKLKGEEEWREVLRAREVKGKCDRVRQREATVLTRESRIRAPLAQNSSLERGRDSLCLGAAVADATLQLWVRMCWPQRISAGLRTHENRASRVVSAKANLTRQT